MLHKTSTNIFVFNSKGELALQLRAAHDDSYPSHWDSSAAGSIDEGEDPAHGAKRELREELGIDAEVQFVGEDHCRYLAWGTNEEKEDHVYIYSALYDGEFVPDPGEVQDVKFFSLVEIATMLQSGHKFHPEFKILWDKGMIVIPSKQIPGL